MANIIFNADDFGLSKGVNEGIVACYRQGVVNSSSLMTNTKYFDDAVQLIKLHALPNIGLHFNLTEFQPLLKTHQTLVDAHGSLQRNCTNFQHIDLKEVELELEAQFQKALDAGVTISHFDSHHHIHMSELFKKVFLQLSKKHKIPLRNVANTYKNPLKRGKHFWLYKNYDFYTQRFSADFYDNAATLKTLIQLINQSKKSIEIMCHPGFIDAENGIYNEQRLIELKILTDINLKKLILQQN